MKIAIVGWGSLIWDRRDLELSTRWHRNGPELPVEFARKSRDGRLTLVIQPGVAIQQTYWARSGHHDFAAARANLRRREGTSDDNIICVEKGDPPRADIGGHAAVVDWLATTGEHDVAIFTGLPVTPGVDTHESAVEYLLSLDAASESFRRAKEYMTKTPDQIDTFVRQTMRQQHGWADVPVPPECLER